MLVKIGMAAANETNVWLQWTRDVRLLVEIGMAAANETNGWLQWMRDVRLLVEIGTAAADETNGFSGRETYGFCETNRSFERDPY